MSHVDIIMLHVGINKSYMNIIKLHSDIILHVGDQMYANIELLSEIAKTDLSNLLEIVCSYFLGTKFAISMYDVLDCMSSDTANTGS